MAGSHLYGYVGAEPISRVDAEGLQEVVIPVGEPWVWPTISPITRPTIIDPAGAIPIPDMNDPNGGGGNNCDPCKGLLNQLLDHERKLAEYKANPFAHDNKGFLGQGRDEQVINSRITKLEKSIEDFRNQYYACLRKHGVI